MYDGWLSFAGTEIINVQRLLAYRDSLLPTLTLLDCTDCPDLSVALGDNPYTTPVDDEASWYDPDRPDSAGFLGFMPTSLGGFTDSTRTASVTQSIFDGGSVGKVRRGTRDMRVSGWLIGTSVAAAEAGFTWLKAALDGSACSDCEPGDDLCFMIACPSTPAQADSYARHLRRVTCVEGPLILATRDLSSCGGHMIQVEFSLVAGTPYVYGEPIVVATASGSTLDAVIDGALVYPMTKPLARCNQIVSSGSGLGSIINDPDCPKVPLPPTVPALSTACKELNFLTFNYYTTGSKAGTPVPSDSPIVANSGAYEARPYIATADGGATLKCIYSESPTYGNNAGSIVRLRTSTTGGATWSSATTVYDEGSGTKGSEPAALRWVQSKGKFMMATIEFNLAVTPRTFTGRFWTSSTAAAGTWTEVSNLDALMASKGAVFYLLSDFIHNDNGTPDGVLYAVGHVQFTGESLCVFVVRSTDFGATWQWLGVPHPRGLPLAFQFPCIAIYPNGELLITVYVPGTKPNIYWMKSTNGGSSWTYPQIAATNAKGKPTTWVTEDDTLIMQFVDMTYPGPRNMGRTGFGWTRDHGRTWSRGGNWTGGSAGVIGGSWCEFSNGDLASVYANDFSDTNANVYFRRWTQIEGYMSYAMYVPDTALGMWQDSVINMQIKTGPKPTRQMRVRFIPRPLDGQLPEDLDPCSVCGSFMIDYAPANTIIYIDGMTERITMKVGSGKPVPADHLVSGIDGEVFSWPILTCGTGYFALVDVDVDTIVDLALGVVSRE